MVVFRRNRPSGSAADPSFRSRTVRTNGTAYCHKVLGRGLSTGISMQR